MSDMHNVINEFLVQTRENLDELDRGLVRLEENPTDRETLVSVCWGIHTIKSTMTAALLAMMDALGEPTGDYSALIQTLGQPQGGDPSKATATETANNGNTSATPEIENGKEGDATRAGEQEEVEPPKLGEILVSSSQATPHEVNEASQLQADGDERRLGEILVDKGTIKPQVEADAFQVQAEAKSSNVANSSIPVDVGLLDKLMNLVGELVLARNQILQFSARNYHSGFVGTSERLNLITTELQVLKTRMQPIENTRGKDAVPRDWM